MVMEKAPRVRFGFFNSALFLLSFAFVFCGGDSPQSFPFQNPSLPIEERVDDLVSRLTIEEKVSQMQNRASAVPRLGIPEYNWWNECLHGVARAGIATVFPQAIGLAASWDTGLMLKVATSVSDEARAKYHESMRQGRRGMFRGLTFWSPNVNIFRDPRWGRGQETYGEDPFLTARMGVAFVRGLQGGDPRCLKTISTPKHFAVHSGPESERHGFNAVVDSVDLFETYLPAFKTCIVEGGAGSIMGAYNRINGEACCGNKMLLDRILRGEWGFRGYVVSDCGAVGDIQSGHRLVATEAEASALAVKTGCDLDCGTEYRSLLDAVRQGLISEKEIDVSVRRLFEARFRLGMFDPPDSVPYARIPYGVVDCQVNRKLALQAARESIVLLKNENGLLPLKRDLRSILVVGPNADEVRTLYGNYNGIASAPVTPLSGIRAKVPPGTEVKYIKGCGWTFPEQNSTAGLVEAAKASDVVVFVGGISPSLEGEEMRVKAPGFLGGDRTDINLPKVQEDLIAILLTAGRPLVLVLLSGSALTVNRAQESVSAILEAWYPGEEGGTAVADVLFGDVNPAGRLPVTFYSSTAQLPPYEDYSMANRTYRYFTGKPLYPFGFGLSYTRFEYGKLSIAGPKVKRDQSVPITVEVRNAGKIPGDEVVQLYIHDVKGSTPRPIKALKGFQRVTLAPGEKKTIRFTLTPEDLSMLDSKGRWGVEAGEFEVMVGASSEDIRVRGGFEVTE
jgi:beta-glucosidase